MRREIRKILLMAIGIISLLSSCVNENEPADLSQSEKAFVKIGAGTRALTGDDLDNEIISLRIITFKPGGSVTGNKFFNAADLEVDPFVHQMMSGTYDFVFIANENNGAELDELKTTVFTGSKKINDLNAVSIPGTLFNQSGVIPMFKEIHNVKVLPGYQGIEESGSVQATWGIDMNRLGVRIDMILRSKVNIGDQISAIKFYNVPDAVPLRGNYSGGTSMVSRSASEVIKPLEAGEESAEYIWGKKAARVILPSHIFTPTNDPARILKIELVMGGNNPSVTLGYNEPTDYTLPPNINFKGEATIGPQLELHLTPVDWTTQKTDGDILGRTLNVSSLKKYLIDGSTDRIYFNSNQANVTIETDAAKWSTSTSADVNVPANSVFDNIAGIGAANFNYTYNSVTGAGTGYVDLKALSAVTGGVYKIYLNAGGLKREIKVAVMTTLIKPNVYYEYDLFYIGTFHRWDETDERRITLPATGSINDQLAKNIKGDWVAVAKSGKEWIRLDTEAFGSNGGQVNPGAGTIIDGTALSGIPIKFRVGLTGKHPAGVNAGISGNAQPRYGLIHVYYGNDLDKVHPIYVRQGEASDYLMRNTTEDNPKNGPMAGVQRNLAKRISPYNLTDLNGGSGRVGAVTKYKYNFTRYPSQAGYLFQWYQTWAWSPAGIFTTDWLTAGISDKFWNTDWESCPDGYRRPNDGSTTEYVPSGTNTASNSEWRQSIWLNPQNGTADNTDNSIVGYLADGFFDKGTIADPEMENLENLPFYYKNSAVSPGTVDVAYRGRLFYNPNNNASVFFPFTGSRDYTTGKLTSAGFSSMYFSTTSANSSPAASSSMQSNIDQALQAAPNRQYGFSIRCVKE